MMSSPGMCSKPSSWSRRGDRRPPMPSAQLNQEPDPGPFLPIERQVDEGRNAHQIEARGREVTARDSDRLDGLVDSTGPDRMNLDAALTPDDSGNGPGYRDRLRGGSSLEHFYGRPTLARHADCALGVRARPNT